MRIFKLAFVAFALFGVNGAAHAACWRLPNGSIVETSSNSTSPAAGAKRVMCSQFSPLPAPTQRPNQQAAPVSSPPIEYGVVPSDRRSDPRECVDYARSRVPSLPSGLFTIQDKRKIINSSRARAGSIAIIEVPSGGFAEFGHVAYVEAVSENSITISETNFGGRQYQKRTSTGRNLADAEARLRIVGYFRP